MRVVVFTPSLDIGLRGRIPSLRVIAETEAMLFYAKVLHENIEVPIESQIEIVLYCELTCRKTERTKNSICTHFAVLNSE